MHLQIRVSPVGVFKRLSILLVLLQVGGQNAFAQDTVRTQVWPEVDLFYKINNDLRIYALKSATRLKNSDFTDGGYGVYIDYFAVPWLNTLAFRPLDDSTPAKYVWIRVGYTYSSSVPGAEYPSEENALVTEANARFYFPFHVLMTARNRLDWRSVNGDYLPRYRPRLRFEKDMHTTYLTFTAYTYVEYYYNFHDHNSDRLRFCAGVEFKATKILNFEVYGVRQFEVHNKIALYATGVSLKIYLSHFDVKKALSRKKKLLTGG
jgi:hypothetical protein